MVLLLDGLVGFLRTALSATGVLDQWSGDDGADLASVPVPIQWQQVGLGGGQLSMPVIYVTDANLERWRSWR